MRYELQVIRCQHCLVVALLLFLLAAGVSVEAQSQPPWQIGMSGLVGRPQGSLKDTVGDNAFGLTVSAGYRLKRIPLLLGVDLGYVGYQTLKLPTSPPAETYASIDLMHFLARIQSGRGAIRPYLDILLGVSQPRVTTNILGFPFVTEPSSNTGFSYGGGAGLMFCVYHKSRDFHFSGNLQMRYLSGSEAEYVRRGSLRLEGGRVAFDTATARHKLLTFGIGVVFDFDF